MVVLVSLLSKPLVAGELSGTIYDFEVTGDILPMHNHDENTAHATIVARGSVKASGKGWEKQFKAGAVIDFPPNQEHQFIALEDNTRIVNIRKKQNLE
jgi:quercetin dioxygenase-like cupin family protein